MKISTNSWRYRHSSLVEELVPRRRPVTAQIPSGCSKPAPPWELIAVGTASELRAPLCGHGSCTAHGVWLGIRLALSHNGSRCQTVNTPQELGEVGVAGPPKHSHTRTNPYPPYALSDTERRSYKKKKNSRRNSTEVLLLCWLPAVTTIGR